MYRFRYRMTTTYTEYNTLLYTVATVTLLYNIQSYKFLRII